MVAAVPLFLKAALHEKMWGGTKLREYGFKLPSERTGEAWIVSAHPHGPSTVTNGQFAGQTLGNVWQDHPELFGGHPVDEAFPLLVKILDANRDLSIQVHPDAKLYYGHTAKTEQELRDAVTSGHIDRILRTVPVKAGDFYYVPSGTLHALGTGIVALETQQSSDLTFRFYDFDRVDPATGKKRELQVKDALAVTNVPHRDPQIKQEVTRIAHATITQLVNATYFAVEKVVVNGAAVLTQEHRYLIQTVVAGQGSLTVNQRQYRLTKGMSYILPNQIQDYELNGQMTLIESWAK